MNPSLLLQAVCALRKAAEPLFLLLPSEAGVIQAQLSLLKELAVELFVALVTCKALAQARVQLGMLLNVHLNLFVGSLKHFQGLISYAKHIALGSRANCDALGVVRPVLLAVGVL